MKRATNAGRSVVEAFPLSKAAHAFVRIADKLISGANAGCVLIQRPWPVRTSNIEYFMYTASGKSDKILFLLNMHRW